MSSWAAVQPRRLPARRLGLHGLHLAALSTLAVAQPLFAVLDVPFLLFNGAERWDIVVLAVSFTLVPPAALLAVEAAATLVSGRLACLLHLAFVASLVGLLASQALLKTLEPRSAVHLLLAAGAGVGAALLYGTRPAVRTFVTALSPAPLLFLGIFLLFSPASQLVLASEPEPAGEGRRVRVPVVFVMLDELPAASLMDPRGRIDAERLPNIGALARNATWFPNASAVHSTTPQATPAVLSGVRPTGDDLPIAGDHPDSIFTLLARSVLHADEPYTDVCPQRICHERASAPFLTRISSLVGASGNVLARAVLPDYFTIRLPAIRFFQAVDPRRQVHALARSIERERRPGLYFAHVMLPHFPWRYLPSGQAYPGTATLGGDAVGHWGRAAAPVFETQQRHLLQTGYADRLFGRLLLALRRARLYEDALVVVTADHGISFLPGRFGRYATPANLGGLASVPLLVKAPNQTTARISERPVTVMDIVPSIASLLGMRLPWRADGHPALGSAFPTRRSVEIGNPSAEAVERQFDVRVPEGPVRVPFREFLRQRRAVLHDQTRLFGRDGRVDPYHLGARPDLHGRRLSTLRTARSSDTGVVIDGTRRWRDVDPGAPVLPVVVRGRLSGPARRGMILAVALNGRIRATTRTFSRSGRVIFSAIVPPSSLRRGRNRVEVLAVGDRSPRPKLVLLARKR